MASSNIKMLGMYSGWDTESIIQQMMKISQMRIDSKTRSRIALQWKQESLNNIKNDLTDFRRTFLTALGPSGLRISSAFNSTVAKITGKNAGAVSISTSINSAVGSLKIGRIDSLAKNASVTTFGTASRDGAGFKLTDTLGNLFLNTGDVKFDSSYRNASAHINGATISFDAADTLSDINGKIRAAGGNAILFDKVDYQGRAYSQVSVNGKSLTMYADQVITAQQITDKIATPVTYNPTNGNLPGYISFYAKDGTTFLGSITVNIGDSLEDINKKLELTNTGNGIITWEPGSNGNSSTTFGIDVGGGNGIEMVSFNSLNVSIPANTDITADDLIKAYNAVSGTPLPAYNSSNEVGVRINGDDFTVKKDWTLEQINKKLTDDGYEPIKWVAGTTEISSATFSIGHPGMIPPGYDMDVTITTPTAKTVLTMQSEIGNEAFGFKLEQIANETLTTKIDGVTYVTNVYDRGFNWNTKYLSDGSKYATANFTIETNIGKRTIEINSDMTIQDMINKVNSSGAGVTMRYDRLSDQFVIENDRPDTFLEVGGLQALGIFSTNVQEGSRARVWINDELVERNTNTFEYRGMTITLNETTKASGATWSDEDNITVSLTRDATDAVERVKAFVDSYNTIISKLESLLKESKNKTERSYLALTDEEKQNMTDKQIEEWEAIAKKGMLRNDFGIQSMITSLRSSLFETVKSVGLTPSAVGLSTGRYDAGTGSQIVLDEDVLKKALEEDPEKIANLFMGIGEDGQDRGWLWRMDDIITNYVDGSQFRSIYTLEDSIRRANEEIEKIQNKMYEEEDKLYKKFAAMETALSKLQSQADWFNAMLGTYNNK